MSKEARIKHDYLSYINSSSFPCVAGKAAMQQSMRIMVAGHMGNPIHDLTILEFLHRFVDEYRYTQKAFSSAAVIFSGPETLDEERFERLMWQRLQSLSNHDAQEYGYDSRVSSDPASSQFSFSLKEEAFFIIGLHPNNSRVSRRFKHPTLVFNPHNQFEILRQKNRFEKIKMVVRKRDEEISGSINPMLQDYGISSEAMQYSGKKYGKNWTCPLKIPHNNILRRLWSFA